jgi:hypothetical protein
MLAVLVKPNNIHIDIALNTKNTELRIFLTSYTIGNSTEPSFLQAGHCFPTTQFRYTSYAISIYLSSQNTHGV